MKRSLNEYERLILDACTRAAHQSDNGIAFSFEDLMCCIEDEFSEHEVKDYLTELQRKECINKIEGRYYDFELNQ